jgi:hypothetical protein
MTLRDALNGFMIGLRKGPVIPVGQAAPQVAVLPGLENVSVVNTLNLPENSNIPRRWSTSFMGPGQPFAGFIPGSQATTRDRDAENEPRTMQYIPNVNSTIAPRLAWGLTPFSDLRMYAESVPEVAG